MKRLLLLLFVVLAAGIIQASDDLGTSEDRTVVINIADDFTAVNLCFEIPANIDTGAIQFQSIDVFGHYDGVVDLEARESPELNYTIPNRIKTRQAFMANARRILQARNIVEHTSGGISYT